jgi:hypothetical protein
LNAKELHALEMARLAKEDAELSALLNSVKGSDLGAYAPLVNMLGEWAANSLTNQQRLQEQRQAAAIEASKPQRLDIWGMTESLPRATIFSTEYDDALPGIDTSSETEAILQSWASHETQRLLSESVQAASVEPSPETAAKTDRLKRMIASEGLSLTGSAKDVDDLVNDNHPATYNSIFK